MQAAGVTQFRLHLGGIGKHWFSTGDLKGDHFAEFQAVAFKLIERINLKCFNL